MGMNMNGYSANGAGGHTPWKRHYAPMAEINVTPFVDVMLVLLIVFMITAPLLTVGVSVDLPQSNQESLPGSDEPLTVTVGADGAVYLQESPIELAALLPRLAAIRDARNAPVRVFVRADRTVDYGVVMAVMGRINKAGFVKLALVTELETTPKQ